MASGDFDGNGVTDIATGVPGENVGGFYRSGEVAVIYGTVGGLSAAGHQVWSQDTPGILDEPELQDSYSQVSSNPG